MIDGLPPAPKVVDVVWAVSSSRTEFSVAVVADVNAGAPCLAVHFELVVAAGVTCTSCCGAIERLLRSSHCRSGVRRSNRRNGEHHHRNLSIGMRHISRVISDSPPGSLLVA